MGPTPADWARLNARLAADTKASVDPHLEPGEEALVHQPLRPKGGRWSMLSFPRIEVTPPVEFPKQVVLAVTPRRFLVVTHHVYTGEDAALVIARPLDEVGSVERARATASVALSWSAGGTQFTVWVNPWMAKMIAAALQPEPAAA